MLPDLMRTARLTLRPLRPQDAPRMAALAHDVEVLRMTATMPFPYGLSDAEAFITRSLGPQAPAIDRVIDDGAFQGVIGLIGAQEGGKAEIGYWLGRAAWGKGYATEAARAMIREGFARLGLTEITAAAFSDNPASIHVLRKAGFETIGDKLLESRARGPGAWPGLVFRLTRAAWEAAS